MNHRLLVLACGALAREVLAIVQANGWEHVDVRHLPAELHATPRRIPQALEDALQEASGRYDRVFRNYRRVVYLAQNDDPELRERAEACAASLGLAFESRQTGYGRLAPSLTSFVAVA